jgi:polyhydroxyalkanoate synthesis regulator protein
MCGKMGDNEIDSMKNMMAMSVYFVIADAFEIDAMDLEETTGLDKDLKSTKEMKSRLCESVKDMFNGFDLKLGVNTSVKEVVDQIVMNDENGVLH